MNPNSQDTQGKKTPMAVLLAQDLRVKRNRTPNLVVICFLEEEVIS